MDINNKIYTADSGRNDHLAEAAGPIPVRNYKDRLFRILFRSRQELLALYNAVNNTGYTNPDDMTITTLENAIYIGMKNDISFVLYDNMMLYEHQSTDNPNIPLRDLFYVSNLYSRMIPSHKLYSSVRLLIPEPRFIMFYNGTASLPEKFEYRLSDLYQTRAGTEIPNNSISTGPASDTAEYPAPDLELKVLVLNINEGYNESIKSKCESLKGYSIFTAKVRRYRALYSINGAVERAISECIAEGILAEFFQKNRSEVLTVSIFEFDEEKYREVLLEDGFAKGHADGFTEGHANGFTEGHADGFAEGITEERGNSIKLLIRSLQNLGISRQKTQEQLIEQYSLSMDSAQKYLSMHWIE